jgi:hypothetical protein
MIYKKKHIVKLIKDLEPDVPVQYILKSKEIVDPLKVYDELWELFFRTKYLYADLYYLDIKAQIEHALPMHIEGYVASTNLIWQWMISPKKAYLTMESFLGEKLGTDDHNLLHYYIHSFLRGKIAEKVLKKAFDKLITSSRTPFEVYILKLLSDYYLFNGFVSSSEEAIAIQNMILDPKQKKE